MYKIANQMLDVYDDVAGVSLRKLAGLNPKINVMTSQELADLQDTDFALSVITKKAMKLNKFPIDCHDNAWLSNQYFEMNAHKMPKIAAETAAYHIKQACEKFDIEPTPWVVGLAKEAESNVYFEQDFPTEKVHRSTEIDLSKFAEVEQIGDNYTMAQYVMSTPNHVKIACKYFEDYHEKMPLEHRHKYAAAIQKRAAELGMGAQGGKIIKYSSDFYSAHIDGHLRSRATLLEVSDPKFLAALTKLGEMKKELEPQKFAQILHGFDKRAGLDRYYGSYLSDPYQATFAAQPDQYSGYRVKVGSSTLSADDIRKVTTEKHAKIKEYFGHSVADALAKDGVPIFDSLPMDAQEIIAGIANGSI